MAFRFTSIVLVGSGVGKISSVRRERRISANTEMKFYNSEIKHINK
jgi:hypothetical protein